MSPVEAADLAALVFKGTSPRDQKGMSDLQNPEFDPETSIIQVISFFTALRSIV